jgi:hypothetical protein
MKYYSAGISRSQGRTFYAIIFRHPVIKDAKGKYGLRIRRGLNTPDPDVAEKLVAQMNDLLKNKIFWNLDARHIAEKLYDPVIISAFYGPLEVSREVPFIVAYETELVKGWNIINAISSKSAMKKFKGMNPDLFTLCQYPHSKLHIARIEKSYP